jgi:hypothetical protein
MPSSWVHGSRQLLSRCPKRTSTSQPVYGVWRTAFLVVRQRQQRRVTRWVAAAMQPNPHRMQLRVARYWKYLAALDDMPCNGGRPHDGRPLAFIHSFIHSFIITDQNCSCHGRRASSGKVDPGFRGRFDKRCSRCSRLEITHEVSIAVCIPTQSGPRSRVEVWRRRKLARGLDETCHSAERGSPFTLHPSPFTTD